MIRTDGIEIDLKRKTILHGGHRERFKSGRALSFKLTCHLILGFFNREELFYLLYGDRVDGGPDMGSNQIATMMAQKRPIFERLGLQFDKIRSGHYHTRYRLVPKP